MKQFTILLLIGLLASCGRYAKDSEIKDLRNKLDETNKSVNDVNTRLNRYMILVDKNTNAIDNNSHDIYQLELNLAEMIRKLELIELDSPRIVDVFKPCIDAKEVLLELDTGDIIGYYEKGNKRYLSILTSGNYETNDGTNCHFTIE